MMFMKNSIRLRAVEPEDADFMWNVESDSTQWIQNGMSAPLSRHNILDYALSYDADPSKAGQIRLIIERNDKPIGIVDLFEISAIHRHAFVGIYIVPEMRKTGLATESLVMLEYYAFKLLNISQLAARIMSGNTASEALFRKAGYSLRGEIPSWFMSGNKSISLMIYSKILCAH